MLDILTVGVDLSILRHPHAGSARWAVGLYRALEDQPGLRLEPWIGPRRLRRGGPFRKVANLARERWWYDVVIPRLSHRGGADVLLMPANLSARAHRVPQVVTIHDVNFLTQPGTYDRWYAAYARRAFAHSTRVAQVLTTVSRFSQGEISRHLGIDLSRISVVYPGLSPVPREFEFAAGGRAGDPYALYVGATEPHKNLGLLMAAWAEGSPAGLNLVIVGRQGRAYDRLLVQAAALGGRVLVVGAVTEPVLERWYRGASVFLFPSRTEGFGYPPLEAMQRGIPVVAAKAGALPEVLGDGALFHDPDDSATVRQHIESLLGDDALREAQIARGRAIAARYTWGTTGRAMAELIRSVVSN